MGSYRTVAFSKNATNVFFHILTSCNLRCRHCYINPLQHGTKTLDIDTIYAWLEVFAGKKNQVNVIFLGGEPTLHPDLPLAVLRARKLGYYSITIDTNGYLFNDVLSRLNPEDVDYISFSLDGATSDVNDSLRGKGSFSVCMNGMESAVSKGFNSSLIFTVSNSNSHELEKMPALLEKLKISRFFIQVLGIRGKLAVDSGVNSIGRVSAEEWLDIVPDIAAKTAAKGIHVTYPKVFLQAHESFECAGRVSDNYFVFPNGRVYRCPVCEDYPIHSMHFVDNKLVQTQPINEADLFYLDIPEGCVMNKLVQPGNIRYLPDGSPEYRIACCLLKEEINGN